MTGINEAKCYSINGEEFYFEAPLKNPFTEGVFVEIKVNKIGVDSQNIQVSYFGQITQTEIIIEKHTERNTNPSIFSSSWLRAVSREIRGKGIILGIIENGKLVRTSNQDTFEDAEILVAKINDIYKYLKSLNNGPLFPFGKLRYSKTGKINCMLEGMDRHTFLTGQSGSGKSTTIKTIIKNLANTLNPCPKIIMLDFNSDFIDKPIEVNQKIQWKVLRSRELVRNGDFPISIDWFAMNVKDQLGIVGIDPIDDASDYFFYQQYLNRCFKEFEKETIPDLINYLIQVSQAAHTNSGFALENINVANWNIWKHNNDQYTLNEILEKTPFDILVIDLGTLENDIQKIVVAEQIINFLWDSRHKNENRILIIDEAHNLCPRNTSNKLISKITNKLITLVSEGRKYGFSVLICSQQPSKIHEDVLSNCNNLILHQIASSIDLKNIYEKFSQVPEAYIQKARFFDRGEALIAGKIVPAPLFIKFN